jgi:hypothetical protein
MSWVHVATLFAAGKYNFSIKEIVSSESLPAAAEEILGLGTQRWPISQSGMLGFNRCDLTLGT